MAKNKGRPDAIALIAGASKLTAGVSWIRRLIVNVPTGIVRVVHCVTVVFDVVFFEPALTVYRR